MNTRPVTIDVPEKVLLAEKTDAEHFCAGAMKAELEELEAGQCRSP